MLNDVLGFLKDRLNVHLNLRGKADEAQEDQVVFLESNGVETLKLRQGAITALMINLEQENVLRAPDIYARTLSNGAVQKVQPEIRLNVYVLFVADSTQCQRGRISVGIFKKHADAFSATWWLSEPDVGRVAHGVAARVDRLKAIGNGQVPQCAAEAWRILTSE